MEYAPEIHIELKGFLALSLKNMKIPDRVWQMSCDVRATSASGELLYDVLLELGVDPMDIVEKLELNRSRIEIFKSKREDAEKIATQVRAFGLKGVKVSVKVIKKSDWQDLWKKGIKPFALTPKIEIIPAWAKAKRKKNKRFPIYINTNLAFGTGLHETTRFMSQIIEDCSGQFKSFLDIGTGSGILTIVAHHCGAQEMTALDIDSQSIPVAKENLAANRIGGVKIFVKDFAKWDNLATYDFVAANLVTHDLMKFGKGLVRLVKPAKFLAVSGISLENLPLLKKTFQKLPLIEAKILYGKTWSAVLYQRR